MWQAHARPVRSLALSPDERLVASGDEGGEVRTWSLDGEAGRTFPGHHDRVTGLVFADGGRVLASSSWDGSVRTWDEATAKPEQVWIIGLEHLRALHASPDGRRLLISSHAHFARVLNLDGGPPLLLPHTNSVYQAVFSPDGRRILSVGGDAAARLWDAQRGDLLGERRVDDVLVMGRFSPDGTQAALVGWHAAARLWRFGDAEQPPPTAAGLPAWLGGMSSAAVDKDGRLATAAGDAGR
jgi:WD40 repeat protein